MQDSSLLLIVAAAGLLTGALQFQVLIWGSSLLKTWEAHLDDLRLHLYIAFAILSIIFLLIVIGCPQNRVFFLLEWSGKAFIISWITIIYLRMKMYLATSPEGADGC